MNSFVADFSKEMKEVLKDVLKNQPKSPTKRPSIAKVTQHEQICSKEKPAVQKPEIEQPLPFCKEDGEEASEDETDWQPRWDIYPEDCPEEKPPDSQQLQDHADSRTNPFQVGGDDVILPSMNGQDGHTDVPSKRRMGDPMEVQNVQTNDPTNVPRSGPDQVSTKPRPGPMTRPRPWPDPSYNQAQYHFQAQPIILSRSGPFISLPPCI